MYKSHTQSGMTLIEIMIALTLSLILTGGVIQLFLTSKQTFRMNEAMAGVQESGRFALETLSRDLRMAGYQGCADPGSVASESIVKNNSPTDNLLQTALAGNEGTAAADSFLNAWIDFNRNGLTQGVYFVRIETGNRSGIKKLVITD